MANKAEERLVKRLKATVGYREAKDKDSYLVGAKSAIHFCTKDKDSQVEALENKLAITRRNLEDAKDDLETLARIIRRYS